VSTLRILHISDFHARAERERDAWRRRRVLGEAWDRNLDELLKEGPAVDLVAFTGDIADWGLPCEYLDITPFLDALLSKLGLGWDRLYEWGDAEARRLAAGVVGPRPDVPLDVWQQLFRPSLTASIDAYERILETSLPPALHDRILQHGRRG